MKEEKVKKYLKISSIVLAVVIVVLLGVFVFWHPAESPSASSMGASLNDGQIINNAGYSIAANGGVMSSDGNLTLAKDSVHPNDVIASPLVINGVINGGGWFFEATFPVKILDGDGTVIGTSTAHAESQWQATSSVSFQATIYFKKPQFNVGTVVLENDNPSGLAENARVLDIPVRFNK